MSKGISDQMYHRVFRLVRRGIDNHTIAATLGLPVKTIENLVSRFKSHSTPTDAMEALDDSTKSSSLSESPVQSHLDIFIFTKTRYVEVQVSGDFTAKSSDRIEMELQKILASDWKTIAFKMSGVKIVDETAMKQLQTFHQEFLRRNRYSGILDPSTSCEDFLEHHDSITIPVFGTEAAFEQHAFTLKAPTGRK